MRISKEKLFRLGLRQGISPKQLEALWNSLSDDTSSYLKWLYFLGALIAIFAMTWFLNLSWEWFGSLTAFGIASVYALLFLALGNHFWKKAETRLPGGLLVTMAVCMVPLMIYSLQTYFNGPQGLSPYPDFYRTISGQWVFMELGTIVAGLAALRYFSFSFLMAPISVAAWFLTMDLIPYFFGTELTFDQKAWISLFFGVVLFALSYLFKEGFWPSLFGALTFYGAMGCLLFDRGEYRTFLFFLISLLLMPLSIYLKKNILMLLGALGSFAYLAHLSYKYFQDSLLFPILLSLIGLSIIYAGIWFQKHYSRLFK